MIILRFHFSLSKLVILQKAYRMTFVTLIVKPFNCGFYLQTDKGWWGGTGGKPASSSEPSFSSINEGLGPGSLLVQFSSFQFSRSVVSNSLRPHGLQHTRLPVHHQLLELAQTPVHQGSDAIQPSHPLSSPVGNLESK